MNGFLFDESPNWGRVGLSAEKPFKVSGAGVPETRITDILTEVDNGTSFTETFTHLHTGTPCRDKIGLLNVLLAEGLNLGLSKIANATSTRDFIQLSRLSRPYVETEGMARALAMVIDAQSRLPSRGRACVDGRRVLSGIIFINRNGLMWCDAPAE